MEFKKKAKKPKEHEKLMAEIVRLVREGDRQQASAKLDELLENHPDRLDAHVFALEACRQLDRHEDALFEMAVVLALEPEYFAVHHFLAQEALARGNRALAKVLLDAAWEIRKDDVPKKLRAAALESHYRLLSPEDPPPADADDDA
ncbi:MAG TPA: hypothetical protein DER07_01295 [Armatimonadetes bacterium]|jgi:tetratricopeptide (TPR) repeat protein|nr:hypothetical protein [Armatimonadota bacterium]MCA1996664.1 hypothetical protein [Armatimonadota bacterium]HCD99659.1 hypothetical protein [Armatimonadota bacterium]